MLVELFLELGVFLILLLAILLLLFFLRTKEKRAVRRKKEIEPTISLEALLSQIKSKESSKAELQKSIELILHDYGSIDDFSLYKEILFAITLHPHTNKNLILSLDKGLSKRNPEYKKRISDAVTDALKLR